VPGGRQDLSLITELMASLFGSQEARETTARSAFSLTDVLQTALDPEQRESMGRLPIPFNRIGSGDFPVAPFAAGVPFLGSTSKVIRAAPFFNARRIQAQADRLVKPVHKAGDIADRAGHKGLDAIDEQLKIRALLDKPQSIGKRNELIKALQKQKALAAKRSEQWHKASGLQAVATNKAREAAGGNQALRTAVEQSLNRDNFKTIP